MEIELPPNLPVGFRFHPTDVELITSYLRPKIVGKPFDVNAIAEVDLLESEPWELPHKSKVKSKDRTWWFLYRRDFKYSNSQRSKRTTKTGYWKINGPERLIKDDDTKVCIGRKRTLVFHSGPTPGKRTNWVMHEIYLDPHAFTIPPQMASYVICKLKKKTDEKVDTPAGEIAYVLEHPGPPPEIVMVIENREPNAELSLEFEGTDPLDLQLGEEDLQLLSSFIADSHEEFAYLLIDDPTIPSGDSNDQLAPKRPYLVDEQAEGLNGLQSQTMESSGSKKVRQMRMSKTPSDMLQTSAPSRHFVREQTVSPVSVPVPLKESYSNSLTNEPDRAVSSTITAVTPPQSPRHVAVTLTGGVRQKRIQFQKNGLTSWSPSSSSSVELVANKGKKPIETMSELENIEESLKAANGGKSKLEKSHHGLRDSGERSDSKTVLVKEPSTSQSRDVSSKKSELTQPKLSSKRFVPICYYCGLPGHIQPRCFKYQQALERRVLINPPYNSTRKVWIRKSDLKRCADDISFKSSAK